MLQSRAAFFLRSGTVELPLHHFHLASCQPQLTSACAQILFDSGKNTSSGCLFNRTLCNCVQAQIAKFQIYPNLIGYITQGMQDAYAP